MDVLQTIVKSIKEANQDGALFKDDSVLTGFSGESLCGTLQRLSKNLLTEESCYLEVGVFQGLTLLSVASVVKDKQVYGIDNFAFFDKDKKNQTILEERKKKLNLNNAILIDKDYEDALENLNKHIGSKKVGVYFIDGPHDYRSQLMCLLLIKPHLAKNAVIVIDDCNYRHVRQANCDFLKTHSEFKLIYQSYTKAHPVNLSREEKEEIKKGWWNGVNIIVKDDENLLEEYYPVTLRDRTLYENDHLIRTTKYPEFVPKILKYSNMLASKAALFKSPRSKFVGKYQSLNTYSETLPKNDFNPSAVK